MDVVLLFPGQGSQKPGMGKDLADAFPAARETSSSAPTRRSARPLSTLCFEGPAEELTLTHNAQPALLDARRRRVGGRRATRSARTVVAAAGHSLGEFTAYHAAESLTLEDAVRLVRRRGELMYESGVKRPGAMAAILGDIDASDRGDLRRGDARSRARRPGELQLPRAARDQRRGGRRRARDGAGQGSRRQARHAAQRERRVPLAAHGSGCRRA